jgi:hypothetical protein
VKGSGNSVNHTESFPHNSPYAFSENRVIDAIELEELEAFHIYGKASDLITYNKMTEKKTQA